MKKIAIKDKDKWRNSYFWHFKWTCSKEHDHDIYVSRMITDTKEYKIKNAWDNNVYDDPHETNGYTVEEQARNRKKAEKLRDCPDFADYPKEGIVEWENERIKVAPVNFNERDLSWISTFENDWGINRQKGSMVWNTQKNSTK